MSGRDTSRAMVGGPGFGPDFTGFGPATGFERISTGEGLGEPIPGPAGSKVTNWRAALNWQHNPTFWIMVFALAAIGFIHARLQVGPAHVGIGR